MVRPSCPGEVYAGVTRPAGPSAGPCVEEGLQDITMNRRYGGRAVVLLLARVSLLAAGVAAQTPFDCGTVNGAQLASLFTAVFQTGASQHILLNNCAFDVAVGPPEAAAPAFPPSTTAPAKITPLSPIAKRGIGTWNPVSDLGNLKGAAWWYSWGVDPGADAIAAGQNNGFEFVSMIVRTVLLRSIGSPASLGSPQHSALCMPGAH